MQRGGKINDLSAIVFKFFTDRAVQLRRRLCVPAADSGTGGYPASVAHHERVYRSDHDLSDDPGAIAVNSATFVGIKIAGIGGALCATAGCILPSCIIVTLLAKLYFKYRNLTVMSDVLSALRPAVVAMIAAAGVSVLVSAFWGEHVNIQATQWVLVAAFAVCFVLLRKTKLNPVWVMVIAGVINTAYTLISSAVTS